MDPLIHTLRDPESATELSPQEWDWLLRAARRARLLAHVSYLLEDKELLERCPPRARDALIASRYRPAFTQTLARREIRAVLRVLGRDSAPLILLKGAAYIFAELPVARGRQISDVDVLVPRSGLEQAEARLTARGWEPQKLDSYDQRYYREWMHEIPPLKHPRRGMEVDIHHALLPITARLHPNPDRLWEASLPLDDGPLRILAPADMVLHSAAHLFYDGEIEGGFRDLVDLHQLMIRFGRETDFWETLLDRAETLELGRPLYYALHFCTNLLGTGVPLAIQGRALDLAAPSAPVRALMDRLVRGTLRPRLPGEAGAPASAWLLYLRSHWLRMPPLLLAGHLSRKTWRRIRGNAAQAS